MSKYDIYFKLELVADQPEFPELDYENTDMFNLEDIMLTAWYNSEPFMLDEQLTEAFPDLIRILSPFTIEEPCEGTIIISNPPVTIDTLAELLKAEGYSVDYGDDESEYIEDED